MSEEVRIGGTIVAFDGRVLELFGQGNQSRRIHVDTIEKVDLSGSLLQIKVRGESDTFFELEGDESERAAVEALLGKLGV